MQTGRIKAITLDVLNVLVLIASGALIGLISLDVFHLGFGYLNNGLYLRLQVPVCILFLTEFFVSLYFAADRWRYFRHNLFFLLISIPYTAIAGWLGIHLTGVGLYVLHFMPTLRAVLALSIVIGFVSKNPVIGLFASYAAILLMVVYFSSLIFYLHESGVNPGVRDYWSALWWTILQTTTLGASFYAVTTVGKAIAMIVSLMGMLMFPLFTVYLTQIIRRLVVRRK